MPLVVECDGSEPPQKGLSEERLAQARRHGGNHIAKDHIADPKLPQPHMHRLVERAVGEFSNTGTNDIVSREGSTKDQRSQD